jgi:predicted permease
MFVGFIASRYFEINKLTISKLVIYIFSPALVFQGIYSSNTGILDCVALSGTFIIFVIMITLISVIVHHFLRLEKDNRATFILCIILSNVGNFGIPVIVFTFGEKALGTALIILVLSNILTNTLGIYIASNMLHNSFHSLRTVFKTPALYAAVLALVLNSTQLSVPDIIFQPVGILAHATIPLMLVLLGAQLHNFKLIENLKLVISTSLVKLVLAPLIAFFVVSKIIILPSQEAQIFILQMSMPSAVFAMVLVEEFGDNSNMVANIVTFTTGLSILTIPIITFLIMHYL